MIRRPEQKSSVETIGLIQLGVTVVALTLAPLFFGSTDQVWVAAWTILLSFGALLGMAVPMGVAQRRILSAFLFLCFAYAMVAIVQVVPHLIDQLNDPIWQRAIDLLGFESLPRISSRAEIPAAAIGHFLLLVTSFVGGFFVGTSRRNGNILMAVARYSILAYAIYGLAALMLTPHMLLWTPKHAYHDSLTATFVNHNTAATFLGAGTLFWLCSACLSLQSFHFSSFRLLLLTPSNEHIAFKVILRLAAGFTCFFALLLTGSRGGLICSCLGLMFAIGLMLANRLKPGVWHTVGAGSIALAVSVFWLSRIGRIGSQGFFDEGRWSVYRLCIEAIGQRPLLGAGAGTFADLFPSLRTADFNSWGVWDFAHSTILEIGVEMGIPVAAMVVFASAASLFILARGALKSKGRSRSSLAAIAGIAALSYLHAMIDFSLQIPGYLIVFAILLGCGLARSSLKQTTLYKFARAGSVQSDPKLAYPNPPEPS